jgi:hypothetical protein
MSTKQGNILTLNSVAETSIQVINCKFDGQNNDKSSNLFYILSTTAIRPKLEFLGQNIIRNLRGNYYGVFTLIKADFSDKGGTIYENIKVLKSSILAG